ncbi:MAG: carboxypeptidase-like regulatory domain-containing protein [Bacteroidetes bacterium]|nr:carboxypeptidase-like regulatory domain-containing protein [Bacteroidota bacterium]
MKHESEHKNKLTLLLRWLRGDATRHDEQALEAHSQGDPFLGEAFGGYRSLPEGDHAAAVTRLKAKLRQRTQRRRGTALYLLRVAAVGAVLVAAWAVFRQVGPGEKSQPGMADAVQQEATAPVETFATETAPAPAKPAASSAEEMVTSADGRASSGDFFTKKDQVATLQNEQPEPVAAPQNLMAPTEMDEVVAVMDSSAGPTDADDQLAEKQEVAEAKMRDEEAAKPTAPAAKRKMADAPAAASTAAPIRQVTGTVTDENGDPLIGANVLVPGTNFGSITNIDGSYSLNLPSNVQSLEFSYTGYNTLKVAVGSETRLDVTMNENSAALSEVVVSAYGMDKARQQKIVSPKPDGGFRKFEKYIRENLRHPEAATLPRPRREVTIRFSLQADGSLADFAPVGPVAGQAYIDEAIRLLREGPKWKGDAGTEASYTVVFE